MPGDQKRDGAPTTETPPQQVPPGTMAILPDTADPRPIGELLGEWIGAKVEEVDDLVAEAHAKVAAIPDQRSLWLLAGEILVRLAAVEQELARLRKAGQR